LKNGEDLTGLIASVQIAKIERDKPVYIGITFLCGTNE